VHGFEDSDAQTQANDQISYNRREKFHGVIVRLNALTSSISEGRCGLLTARARLIRLAA
jgi:hypothetical protein